MSEFTIQRSVKMRVLSLIVAIAAAFATVAVSADDSQLDTHLQKLITMHRSHMQGVLKNASYDGFTKTFFTEAAFLENRQSVRFLKQVQAQVAASRENPNLRSSMSFTRMTVVNGQYRAVQYNFAAVKDRVVLSRMVNHNGEMLKSVYNYDINGRLLKVKDSSGERVIEEKLYKI